MARINTLTNFLTDVADAIRGKKKTSEKILASNFDEEINSLDVLDDYFLRQIPSNDYDKNYWERLSTNSIVPCGGQWCKHIRTMPDFTISGNSFGLAGNMYSGFYGTTIDVSPLIGFNVWRMDYMFAECPYLTTILNLDKLTLRSTGSGNYMTVKGMFRNCESLTEMDLTSMDDTYQLFDIEQMFRGCKSITDINISNVCSPNIGPYRSLAQAFYGCENLVNLNLGTNIHPTWHPSMEQMFYNCKKLTTLPFTVTERDPDYQAINSDLTSVKETFYNCESLTGDINLLNLGVFLDAVTDASWCFYNCKNIQSVTLGNYEMDALKTTRSMFEGCTNLTTVNLSSVISQSGEGFRNYITNAQYMFRNCSKLKTITGRLDLRKANFSYLFSNCTQLETVDCLDFYNSGLHGFYTCDYAFYNCTSLKTIDLSTFKPYYVHLNYTFKNCTSLELLDISALNFDTAHGGVYDNNVTAFVGVPNNCLIYVKDQFGVDWFANKYPNLTNVQIKTV